MEKYSFSYMVGVVCVVNMVKLNGVFIWMLFGRFGDMEFKKRFGDMV